MEQKYSIEMLAIALSKFEAKKLQVGIGNIREILAILSDLVFDDWQKSGNKLFSEIGFLLWKNGQNRYIAGNEVGEMPAVINSRGRKCQTHRKKKSQKKKS